MSFGGGGSGGSGTQRYEWNEDLAPYWRSVLSRGSDIAKEDYVPYNPPGQIGYDSNWNISPSGRYGSNEVLSRIAGINPYQQRAMQGIRAAALQGTGSSNAARDYLTNTLSGKAPSNPYAASVTPLDHSKGGAGAAYRQWAANNPLAEDQDVAAAYDPAKVTVGRNEFSGMDSPYFQRQLNTGLKSIGDAYKNTTDANTRRMFNLAGAFGGGAHQETVKNNEEALGEQLGNFTNNMLQQQYDRSANLSEADLSRQMQAQQFNVGQGANAYENWANRDFQGGANDMARRERGFENFVNRDLQARQFDKNLGGQWWENAAQRQLAAVPYGLQTEGMEFERMRQLMGAGDGMRAYEQQIRDMTYNNWLAERNYNRSNLDYLTGLMSRAQGGMAPNVTTSYPGTQISPFGALLGAGALYGAMR